MPGLVLTLPIAADQVETWRRFCQALASSHLPQYEASRRRLGITREQLTLVETAFGTATVSTLEAADVGAALSQISTSNLPFDRWYREQMQTIHGIHLAGYVQFAQPNVTLPYPPEVLFEWPPPPPTPREPKN